MTPRSTTTTRTLSHGTTAKVTSGGRVTSIHTAGGATITRTSSGARTIVSSRGGRTIVTTGRGRGYVERPYITRGGRSYYQRTYMYGGHRYAYAYARYSWHGGYYYRYAPAFYYRPAFYGWVYNPWVTPVYYTWGWYHDPWYTPYAYYFAPAPYYPVASLWLTDYLIAQSIQAAADAAAEAPAPAPGPAPAAAGGTPVLTPETKQLIADEVKRQLDAERAAAGNSSTTTTADNDQVPAALDPANRTFVVATAMDVTAGDQQCSLAPGDVITRIDDNPDKDQNVNVMVTSSQKADCPSGEKVVVAVNDLQEMHNHFRERIDDGLKQLAENNGKNNLPKAPDTQTKAGDVPAPAADDVQADLTNQQKEADQTEKEVKQQVSTSGQG